MSMQSLVVTTNAPINYLVTLRIYLLSMLLAMPCCPQVLLSCLPGSTLASAQGCVQGAEAAAGTAMKPELPAGHVAQLLAD